MEKLEEKVFGLYKLLAHNEMYKTRLLAQVECTEKVIKETKEQIEKTIKELHQKIVE